MFVTEMAGTGNTGIRCAHHAKYMKYVVWLMITYVTEYVVFTIVFRFRFICFCVYLCFFFVSYCIVVVSL